MSGRIAHDTVEMVTMQYFNHYTLAYLHYFGSSAPSNSNPPTSALLHTSLCLQKKHLLRRTADFYKRDELVRSFLRRVRKPPRHVKASSFVEVNRDYR